MDEAVLTAYGWHEDSEKWGKAIDLRHDFYEVDYLPENDSVRYTIHPEARKEVLKRLLLLNHERFEEEVKKGLHKKKDVKAYYEQKGKSVPEDLAFSDAKGSKAKPKKAKAKKSTAPTNQSGMFGAEENVISRSTEVNVGSRVTLKNISQDKLLHLQIAKGTTSQVGIGDYQPISITSQLALQMLNRKVGYTFQLGENEFEIVMVE